MKGTRCQSNLRRRALVLVASKWGASSNDVWVWDEVSTSALWPLVLSKSIDVSLLLIFSILAGLGSTKLRDCCLERGTNVIQIVRGRPAYIPSSREGTCTTIRTTDLKVRVGTPENHPRCSCLGINLALHSNSTSSSTPLVVHVACPPQQSL